MHTSTAYHEAGHAVIAILEGMPVNSIKINGDGSGECMHRNPLRGLNLEYDGSDRARIRVEKAIRIALAGLIAERLHNPRSHKPLWAAVDHERAVDYVCSITGSENEANAYLKLLDIQTRQMLKLSWGKVEALAGKLAVQRQLSKTEILKTNGHMPRLT